MNIEGSPYNPVPEPESGGPSEPPQPTDRLGEVSLNAVTFKTGQPQWTPDSRAVLAKAVKSAFLQVESHIGPNRWSRVTFRHESWHEYINGGQISHTDFVLRYGEGDEDKISVPTPSKLYEKVDGGFGLKKGPTTTILRGSVKTALEYLQYGVTNDADLKAAKKKGTTTYMGNNRKTF